MARLPDNSRRRSCGGGERFPARRRVIAHGDARRVPQQDQELGGDRPMVVAHMAQALRRTYDATPDLKWVVAVGDCAANGGIFSGSYAVVGGVDQVVPVDLHIRGCPPRPVQLLSGLLALLERVA
jgi:hypothetical protein